MKCLVLVMLTGCGRLAFDPAAPTNLTYGKQDRLLVFNDVAPAKTHEVELRPRLIGLATEFSIAPDIESATGLTFDPETGTISGRPDRASPVTRYTITASSDLGESSFVLTLRTAPGFEVSFDEDVDDLDAADDDCIAVADTGKCTLRAAITQLTAFGGAARVVKLPDGTFLIMGELELTVPIEIVGSGRADTKIIAQGASRIFRSANENTIRIADLTMKDGVTVEDGGCLRANGGEVRLARVAFVGCSATSNGGGASLSDEFRSLPMNIEIIDSDFESNHSRSNGGGLSFGSAMGVTTITGTTFVDNLADEDGGAVFGQGVAVMDRDLFVGNAGNGTIMLELASNLTLGSSTVTNNAGGSSSGGVLVNAGTTLIESSTIADNTCRACFLGGGVRIFSGGTVTLQSTIIAGNVDLDDGKLSNIAGSAISNGHNLTDSAAVPYALAAGDLLSTDPLLLELDDNGGATRTRAIADTSPALDAGGAACPARDQRGVTRPARGACDIGAFELE